MFVEEHREAFGVEPVLRELGVSVSTYHDWRRRAAEPSARELRDAQLLVRIRAIYRESEETYGSPRVWWMLRREGEKVARKRVERLMRAEGLVGVSAGRKVRTTIRNPSDPLSDDLVNRDFTAGAPDRLWVTDLTMIPTGQGPLWLASIRDAFSRRIVGWHASEHPDAALVLTALEYALAVRRPPSDESLIHHADHGSQYTSIALTSRLVKVGIKPSMGTVGDSYDNALAENMWSVIKTECVRRTSFATRAQAEAALFAFIDGRYNTRRIQMSLGGRTPDEYEAAYWADPEGFMAEHRALHAKRLAKNAARKAKRDADRAARRAAKPADTGPALAPDQPHHAANEPRETAGAQPPITVRTAPPKAATSPRRTVRDEPRQPPTRSPRAGRGPVRSPGKPETATTGSTTRVTAKRVNIQAPDSPLTS
jgi:putative transposase